MRRVTFTDRLVALAKDIPAGRVTTYGDLVKAAGGSPRLARSVTHLLSQAVEKEGVSIPFHRIVYSNGRVWLDQKHHKERIRLYQEEGIVVTPDGKIKNFDHIRM